MKNVQYSLDITADICPITMVKTKLLLEDMPVWRNCDHSPEFW